MRACVLSVSPSKKPSAEAQLPAPQDLRLISENKLRSFWVAGAVFLVDQLTKALAIHFLQTVPTQVVLPGIFHLTLVRNTGVAFGLFAGQGFLVAVTTVLILLALLQSIWKRPQISAGSALSLGLIVGGALGNLLDRLRLGTVIDFLDFRIWPVFNVADSCITIGTVLLIFKLLFRR